MKSVSFVDSLGRRSLPYFGQLVLTVLILCAVPLAIYFEVHPTGIHPRGERTGPCTVLSCLPDAILLQYGVRIGCGVMFAVGGILWVLRRGLPWSCWACALGFLGVLCLYVENASQVTHVAHLTAHLLLVHALWYQFYAGEIRSADRAGRFWSSPLYPHWVYFLSVFAIGTFYGWSGLSKLLESGFGWANGLPLQLWTNLWGKRGSMWTNLILDDRRFAALLQATTLVGETAGFLAVVWKPARPWIGLLLIGFHIGQIEVFEWGFHANMLMLGLFFLPVEPLVRRWAEQREARLRAKTAEAGPPAQEGPSPISAVSGGGALLE
jgi:hypothetical protein